MKTPAVPATSGRPNSRISRAVWIAMGVSTGLSAAGSAVAQDAGGGGDLQEVVVTGSRIVRRDLTSASPIMTVSSESLTTSAQIGVEAQLNKLPQFSPGGNQFGGAGDVQASPTNSPGAATLNLRGLGANRSLVLIDGRRAQPFNASLAIDINSIPSSAIDSVEVITGGAAAVYGADAIAGVVNFKLKRNFTGVEFDGQWGATEEGDGEQIQGSILLGANLDEQRGNVMIGVNYAKRDPVFQRDREFYSAAYTDPLTNADIFLPIPQFSITDTSGFVSNAPSQAAVNCVFAGVGAGCAHPGKRFANGSPVPVGEVLGGAAAVGGANLYGVNSDGTVFFPGRSATSRAVGYNGPLAPEFKVLGTAGNSNNGLVHNNTNAQLSLPLERYSLFANSFYEISDRVTAFAQGSYTQTQTSSVGNFPPASIAWSAMIPYNSNPAAIDSATVGFGGATLPQYVARGCAPFGGCTFGQSHAVPAELKTLLDSRAQADAAWNLNTELRYMGATSIINTTDTYQLTVGFRGEIPEVGFIKDWTWEAYGSHGDTNILTDYASGFVNTAAYQTLASQPFFGAGYSNSNNFLGRNATCTTGLPVFTEFTPSEDCLDIVAARMKGTTSIEQNVFEAFLQGGLFNTPGGQVRGVLGSVYRHDGFEFKPDPIMTNSNILSSASGVFDVAKASGATWVTELYGELLVPVMNDLPMVKSLNLELGARWSSYNTAGDISTYKALTTWDIVDSVTIRGGYQLANRAPNVAELFQSPTTIVTIVPTFDACANITTAPYGNVASNPDRARVQALCSTLAGGVPIGDNFVGLGAFSSLALDQQIGNPNLESESATTWTIGTILRSPWQAAALSGLTATIDWYRIEINDAITGLNSATVYEQCFNGTGSSNPNYDANNEFCRLINRDNLFGFPAGVDGIYTNIGAIRTSGIDAQINWSADLADLGTSAPGKLLLNVALNYLNSYEIQTAAGAPFIDYADTTGNGTSGAQFKTKIYTTLGYSIGPVNTRLSWRHLPSLDSTVPGALPNESHNELDLSALWTVGDNLTVRAGVDNLTNEDPEIVGRIPGVNNAVGSTDPGFYDTLGRRFYVGMSAKF